MADLDDVAKRAQEALGKAQQKVADNQGRINSAIDKAADSVDARTKNEHSGRLHSLAERAKEAVDRLATPAGAGGAEDANTPTPLPPDTQGEAPAAGAKDPSPFSDQG